MAVLKRPRWGKPRMLAGCLGAGMILAGCEKSKPVPTTPRQPAQSVSISDLASPPAAIADLPPQPAAAPAVEPAPSTAATKDSSELPAADPNANWNTLGPLNDAVFKFVTDHSRNPKDLNELVALKYLPRLPVPPTGRRFHYDHVNGVVSLVRQ